MVDTGPFPPEPVTDGGRTPTRAAQPPSGPHDWGADLLALPFLQERLTFPGEQVRMWAAYHLVDRWQNECARFIELLWEQQVEEIKDSAINLIGKYRLQQYAFPLLRVFRAEDGALRPLAGVALGRLRYEPAERLVHRWFQEVLANPETNPAELEAAAESLLYYDNATYWDEIHQQLAGLLQNHSFYSVLFALLAAHTEAPEQLERLARAYGAAREVFHDFHLTQHLQGTVGRAYLSRYVQARLNRGYSIATIYREAFAVLEIAPQTDDARRALAALADCDVTRPGLLRFVALADELLSCLLSGPVAASARAFLHGCASWLETWENGILKVREVEAPLLLSVPLAALLSHVEERCLAEPEAEALRITRIYQSPLLSPRFMGDVLNLVADRVQRGEGTGLDSANYAGWVRDEEKDALWRLFTGQLELQDYPFEQVLPQPWQYPVPSLLERLGAALAGRFGRDLDGGRRQAVDYALEVFRRAGWAQPVPTLVERFEELVNHHYHAFVELMTHLPDIRFLPPLVAHYREGEQDLLQLIHFICDVHRVPYPPLAQTAPAPEPAPTGATSSVRLACGACGGSYQYPLEALYVNEERLEQRQPPGPADLWTPEPFACKKCGAEVPLEPDEHFLNDLFTELLAARLMRPGSEDNRAAHLHMIQFPTLDGRTRHPAAFIAEVERELSATPASPRENELLLELGRFRLELGQQGEAKAIFQRLLAGPHKSPHALYYLGIIAFQERNLYEARVHFSRLIQSCSREEFENELDNPVDMAHHYLKLLDKREFKRSHFHLITS